MAQNIKAIDQCRANEDCCPNSHFKCITSICSEDSTSSIGSESSSELFDDASSSSSPKTHLHHGFSEPTETKQTVKKGLSRYYQGKARTFMSLSEVKCVEDLAKKEIPFAKKYHKKSHQSPKSIILKKNARSSVNSLVSKCYTNRCNL